MGSPFNLRLAPKTTEEEVSYLKNLILLLVGQQVSSERTEQILSEYSQENVQAAITALVQEGKLVQE